MSDHLEIDNTTVSPPISADPYSDRVVCTHPYVPWTMADVEQSLATRFEQQSAQYPGRLAIKTRTQEITYAELNRIANRLARAIMAHGPGPEPVCLLLESGIPVLLGMIAALKASKIYVCLDPTYPPATLSYILEDAQTRVLVTNQPNLSLAHSLAGDHLRLVNMDEIDPVLAGDNLDTPAAPGDPAYILYTSGSTGRPKGVVHSHRNVLHNTLRHTNSLHYCAEDRCLLLGSPVSQGVVEGIFPALLNGGTLFPFQLAEGGFAGLRDWLVDQEITAYISVPQVFRQLLASLSGKEQFPHLRIIRLGGDTLLKKDVELFQRHFPQAILRNGLGGTEAQSFCGYLMDRHTRISGALAPVGYALEGVQVLLLDEEGQAVGCDTVGEIVVKSRYLALGYWRDPQLTRAKFPLDPQGGDEHIYLTGDLGRIRPDGCLEHLGRKDFQVKIRGYRVELHEIEMALLDLDNVKEAVVMAHPDPAGEKRLVAYIVPQQSPPPSTRELRLRLAEQLPDYNVPALFHFLEALPTLPNGKLDRLALPVPGKARPELRQDFVPPRDELEAQLAHIWEEVLHVRPVGIHDDFLDLGGHSLAAAQIIARIIQLWGVELSAQVFFEAPTVARMAQRLAPSDGAAQQNGQNGTPSTDGTPPKDGKPLAAPLPITPASREAYRAKRPADSH